MLITTKEGNNNKIFIIYYFLLLSLGNYKKCPIFLNLTNDNDNKSRLLHAFSFFITNKKINFYLTLPH